MIICKYKNKRITLEELSKLLIPNDHSDKFVDTIVLNLLKLKVFLKECLENNYEIESIELLEKNKKIVLGLRFKNISAVELLEKYKYLKNDSEDNFIYFLDTYNYSKDLFNYDPKITPYIKQSKFDE